MNHSPSPRGPAAVRVVAVAVAALLMLCACSGGSTGHHKAARGPIVPHSATRADAGGTDGSGGTATVQGTAATVDGSGVGGVVVGFQSAGCSSCQLYHAVTDTSGAYSLSLPDDNYAVVCQVSGGTCTPSTPDGSSAQVSGDVEIDLTVAAGAGSGDGGGGTDAPGDGSTGGAILSGQVVDANGQPVAGVNIEITFVNSGDAFVTTDASGAYSFGDDASLTVGTVVCQPDDAHWLYQCTPDGLTGPVTFDPNNGPQVINWVVSKS